MNAGTNVRLQRIQPPQETFREGELMFDVLVGEPVIVVSKDDTFIRTSRVQKIEGNKITTRNSVYEITTTS